MIAQAKKTVYFDHNALIYILEKNQKYLSIFSESKHITVVASIWNLYEATGSSSLEQALNIATELSKENVAWIQERTFIQSQELKAFIFEKYFSSNFVVANPIRNHASEAFATLTNDPTAIIINMDPTKLVKAWHFNKNSLDTLLRVINETPISLTTLQDARKSGALTTELQKQVDYDFFKTLAPNRAPSGACIDRDKFEQILAFCLENIKVLYKSCPAIAVENLLMDIRTKNPKRKPEPQDAADLQHAVPAIAYCDFLVTHDGYFRDCANYVVNKYRNSRSKVYGSVSQFIANENIA